MSSTDPVVSEVGLQRFTLFTSLPTEIRFIIWRLSLPHRVVEILASESCTTGFYSQAALPAVLQACRESRQVMKFYAELKLGEAEQGWPVGLEEFSGVQAYAGWKPSNTTKITALYGWRAI